MLWVYDQYKYFYSYSAGIDFRRQILTSEDDPCTVRVKDHLATATLKRSTSTVLLIYKVKKGRGAGAGL